MTAPDAPMIYMSRDEFTALIENTVAKAIAAALDGRRKPQHTIAHGYREAQEHTKISVSKLKQMRTDKKYRSAFLQDGRKVMVYVDVLLELMRK